ncbi:AmiS/UreI family transporter [Fictibacillus sp. KU28468]|uniref:AmiS/UreI family transporter n=1 Tax=Fictibacillus sp. KU28468 TaxID=2991053 RepID=UPI00223E0006|nr:AmiS/UreI family transporter [Fictibacillus sp. KU28468]UZJ78510.1 AmiS/UreI family transporter [Fictibacillus sp. KU28468]
MGDVGLFLSGAALFLNSFMLFGKADGKSVGYFNLFVGVLQVVIPFYLIVISDQQHWTIFNLASIFLFGLTYLFVGVTNVIGLHGSGLGYYSLWVSVIAVLYAVVSFLKFHDTVGSLTWVAWGYLWFLFFLSGALNKKIDTYIGKVAFVQSWVTLTFPALLSLAGVWKTQAVSQAWTYLLIASFVYFIGCTIQLILSTQKEEKRLEVQTAS